MAEPSAAFTSSHSLFCAACGTILPVPGAGENVTCHRCNASLPVSTFDKVTTVSSSRQYAFQKPKYNTSKPTGPTDATIDEKCPRCGKQEMTFTTAQLRSADEGQTVFYRCHACSYSFSTNT